MLAQRIYIGFVLVFVVFGIALSGNIYQAQAAEQTPYCAPKIGDICTGFDLNAQPTCALIDPSRPQPQCVILPTPADICRQYVSCQQVKTDSFPSTTSCQSSINPEYFNCTSCFKNCSLLVGPSQPDCVQSCVYKFDRAFDPPPIPIPSPLPVEKEFPVKLHAGWNMIGPLTTKWQALARVDTNCEFKNDIAYYYDGTQYVRTTELRSGFGYWVQAQRACTINFTQRGGGGTSTGPTLLLHRGYNMISYNDPVALSTFSGCSFIGDNAFHWNGTVYDSTTQLQPGLGYWVKVDRECKMSTQLVTPPRPPIDEPPRACTQEYAPVCGINGKTYGNDTCIPDNVPIAYKGICQDDHAGIEPITNVKAEVKSVEIRLLNGPGTQVGRVTNFEVRVVPNSNAVVNIWRKLFNGGPILKGTILFEGPDKKQLALELRAITGWQRTQSVEFKLPGTYIATIRIFDGSGLFRTDRTDSIEFVVNQRPGVDESGAYLTGAPDRQLVNQRIFIRTGYSDSDSIANMLNSQCLTTSRRVYLARGDAFASTEPTFCNHFLEITLDFGDGTKQTRKGYNWQLGHTYKAPGTYTITATLRFIGRETNDQVTPWREVREWELRAPIKIERKMNVVVNPITPTPDNDAKLPNLDLGITCPATTCAKILSQRSNDIDNADTDQDGRISQQEVLGSTQKFISKQITQQQVCAVVKAWQQQCSMSNQPTTILSPNNDKINNAQIQSSSPLLSVELRGSPSVGGSIVLDYRIATVYTSEGARNTQQLNYTGEVDWGDGAITQIKNPQ